VSNPGSAVAVKLIVSILAADHEQMNLVLRRLMELYGSPDVVGSPLVFHYTDYYCAGDGADPD
jgi:hypothetical protein